MSRPNRSERFQQKACREAAGRIAQVEKSGRDAKQIVKFVDGILICIVSDELISKSMHLAFRRSIHAEDGLLENFQLRTVVSIRSALPLGKARIKSRLPPTESASNRDCHLGSLTQRNQTANQALNVASATSLPVREGKEG
jgi:hypothetical protein